MSDVLLEVAAQRLRIGAQGCIVFEDAQAGIDAAKAAKMTCVGIGDANILNGADMIISGFTDASLKSFTAKYL